MTDMFTEQEILSFFYVGIFLGLLALVSGVSVLLNPRESTREARNRRLRLIASGKSTEDILSILKPPVRSGLADNLPLLSKLPARLHFAAVSLSPVAFITACIGAGFVAALVAFILTGIPALAALAFVVAMLLPFAVLNARVASRKATMVQQLPDALDLLARGLRVGHPLNTSVQAVADEMEDPLATEFGIIFDQVSYGDELTDAFNEFAERVEIEDVSYLAASIGIQHGTGGDLAEVIDILSRVIRARIALRRKVHSISAEGRLTAWFLSALPVIMFIFTMGVSPDYYGGVMNHPWFMPMAGIVIGFTLLNAVILRKLVNFKV